MQCVVLHPGSQWVRVHHLDLLSRELIQFHAQATKSHWSDLLGSAKKQVNFRGNPDSPEVKNRQVFLGGLHQ